MQRIRIRTKKRKVLKQEISTDKQNKIQGKCKNLPGAQQNQNTDINISIDT